MTCLYAPDAPHRDPHHGRRKSHRADMFDSFVIATDQNPVGRRMRELRFRSLHLKRKSRVSVGHGLPSRVLSPMGGFLEEEIKVISLKGSGRWSGKKSKPGGVEA